MKHNEIQMDEIQETTLSNNLKLLYIRSHNPVLKLLNWCENQNYQWLSLPDAINSLGLRELSKLAPSYNDVYFQSNNGGRYGREQRITPELTFNSYVLTQLVGSEETQIDERIKAHIGHDLLIAKGKIEEGFDGENITHKTQEIEGNCKKIIDVSESFKLDGLNSIAWSRARLDIENSGKLEEALFLNSLDLVKKEKLNSSLHTIPRLDCQFPKEELELSSINMEPGKIFTANSFYHKFDEFTTYFIVKGRKTEK